MANNTEHRYTDKMNITLRKIEPSDLPFLYQWENDASSWADGANHNPLSQRDLRDYIESTTGDIYKDGQLRLIIELDTAETVGCIDLFDLDIRNRRAAIGMYIAPEFRNRGIGNQAVLAMEDYASKQLDLRLIYAVIATTNIPCMKLYENLGYEPSSVLKGWTLESDAIIWQKLYH